MAYTFTRPGAQIEEIHNTVSDPSTNQAFTDAIGKEVIPKYVAGQNLIPNSDFSIAGSVASAPDATPRSYGADDELFQGFKAVSSLSGVTYVNGKLNGAGQLYVDVYKTEKQKLSTVAHVASIASSDGLPVESGASFVDSGDYWRVTFDMSNTFSVKFEEGNVSTKHEIDYYSKVKISDVESKHATFNFESQPQSLDLKNYETFIIRGFEGENGEPLNDSEMTFRRRSGFDEYARAGTTRLAGGTLFIYDKNGLAFVEVKSPISKRTRSEGKVSGKQVHIYEWGSRFGGNDWCFVRTPENYSSNGKPHPVVVLNHGNGWVMDGSLEKANFSDKTQFGVDGQNGGAYLDSSRPDYVKYSSPLIEAFLDSGFVVCGAQNDGQKYGSGSAGYGNRETTQNIKEFTLHVFNNYNVENQVNFIAASNGSIATINASRIMQSIVRSVTLLYPLLNLHYAWSTTYSSQVAEAYNFSSSNNFNKFRDNTQGYNPLTAMVDFGILPDSSDEVTHSKSDYLRMDQEVSNKNMKWVQNNDLIDDGTADTFPVIASVKWYRRCIFNYPRIRCHWSPDDTVTPYTSHWSPFKKIVDRGYSTTTFEEQVQGQHGDFTHFEGLDGNGVSRIIAWATL